MTRTMQEREHTLQELEKMEKVRNFLNSRKIAIKVAVSMKRQGLSRQDVADRMGCSPQYISKLLKGEENLSLETICKLEDALNIAILQYDFA